MKATHTSRPWVVLFSDLRRYFGRACDACTSNPARVIFFQARAGRPKRKRWFVLCSNEVTDDQIRAAWAAFGKFRRVRLADLPSLPTNLKEPMNVHPGELLREEFMKPLGLTAAKIAKAIPCLPGRPANQIAEEIADLIRADPDDSVMGLRLSLALDRYFGLSNGYWWRAQADYGIRRGRFEQAAWLARVKPLKRTMTGACCKP